jgi:23S rRNA G2069 N7-methylase RlmK/C1962 C5-methylase RlmI
VAIQASNGKTLGTGYINPHALLCARLISRDLEHPFSPSLLVHRLNVALSLRERLYDRPFYRLIYGEGDGLPGLVVDRYGDFCVAQLTTAGMEQLKDAILAALQKVLNPTAILWRNDSRVRELEGLERYVADAFGTIPDTVTVEEDGLRFQVIAAHRPENRLVLRPARQSRPVGSLRGRSSGAGYVQLRRGLGRAGGGARRAGGAVRGFVHDRAGASNGQRRR